MYMPNRLIHEFKAKATTDPLRGRTLIRNLRFRYFLRIRNQPQQPQQLDIFEIIRKARKYFVRKVLMLWFCSALKYDKSGLTALCKNTESPEHVHGRGRRGILDSHRLLTLQLPAKTQFTFMVKDVTRNNWNAFFCPFDIQKPLRIKIFDTTEHKGYKLVQTS